MIGVTLCLAVQLAAAQPAAQKYDVVVYGGTSGGVAAAVQVARMGKSVVLIEPTQHLGGLSSGGLGATDIGNKGAIGGIAREFYRRVQKHYLDDSAWTRQPKPAGYPTEDAQWTFEPHVAEQVFNDFVTEAKIKVVLGQRLDLQNGVTKEGTKIVAITMESGEKYAGSIFIDTTYEGDLMAKAGVKYHVGREANSQYGETLNGVQTRQATKHQFNKLVDPYVKRGDPTSGLLHGIQSDGPGEEGAGDKRVQAYNFRLCMTDAVENMIPWPKPEGYDEAMFELVLRNVEAGDLRTPFNAVRMPNRKTDTNNNNAVSTDYIGMNYDYPEGDYATREKIFAAHKLWQMGFFWTLANHERVPEQMRTSVRRWGLAKDEFQADGGWPHQMYVREARRMISDYVMTEHNCRGRQKAPQPVGLAAYTMDSHNVQRWVKDGNVINEGDVQVGGFPPYPIAYASLVPKADECTNLFVPVCLSATHIAYGSIRMEPVFMVLGQSAATAAVLAIEDNVTVQTVDYEKLRPRLLADQQILEWSTVVGGIPADKLPGIVVDDADAKLTGDWLPSLATRPYVQKGYHHDNNEEQGKRSARYEAKLPQSGVYEVRVSYSTSDNRATNVRVVIDHAEGSIATTINQKKAAPIDKLFISLGRFPFVTDRPAVVTISNEGADGFVIIDAVQWLPGEGK